MLKSEQRGFSLLEMTIVLALIGLLGAFVVPNLFKNNRGTQRKEFLASFETLLKDTVMRSVVENKMHQIYIDIEHEIMQIREYDSKSIETNQHKKFKKVEDFEYKTEVQFLNRFSIHNFFINGIDEVTAGNLMLDVFFYVMPDGTSQAVIINFADQDSDGVEKDVQVSVVVNPYYARMSVYETFQTP